MIETIKHPILETIKHLKGSNLNTFIVYGHHIQWLYESKNPQYTVEAVLGIEKKSPWPWKYYQVKPSVFNHIIGHNRETVIALVHLKDYDQPLDKNLIILDNVVDYGNIGSIIRNSFMMGQKDFLIINNLNIFNSKTIDASRGLVFYSNVIVGKNIEESMEYVKESKLTPVVAGFNGSLNYPNGPVAIVLGNETNGYSPQWTEVNHTIITIPQITHPQCDSMNVAAAGAILLFKLNNK